MEVEDGFQEPCLEEEEGNLVVDGSDLPSSSFSRPNFNCSIPSTSVKFSQGPSVISRGGDLGRVRVARRGRTGSRPAGVRTSVIRRRGSVATGRVRTAGLLRPAGLPGPLMVGIPEVVPAVEPSVNIMEMVRRRLPPGCSVSISDGINQVHFMFHEFFTFLF